MVYGIILYFFLPYANGVKMCGNSGQEGVQVGSIFLWA